VAQARSSTLLAAARRCPPVARSRPGCRRARHAATARPARWLATAAAGVRVVRGHLIERSVGIRLQVEQVAGDAGRRRGARIIFGQVVIRYSQCRSDAPALKASRPCQASSGLLAGVGGVPATVGTCSTSKLSGSPIDRTCHSIASAAARRRPGPTAGSDRRVKTPARRTDDRSITR
jgi:hypothetical protein